MSNNTILAELLTLYLIPIVYCFHCQLLNGGMFPPLVRLVPSPFHITFSCEDYSKSFYVILKAAENEPLSKGWLPCHGLC